MSEEFKPIRITLSEEAFDRMKKIMKEAKYRSYSSTVEECIRAVHDIIQEVYAVAGKKGAGTIDIPADELRDSMMNIIIRMSRFTGRRPMPSKVKPAK